MSITLYCVGLTATALIAIPTASIAHGICANQLSAVETHDYDRDQNRYRYSGIYFVFPYNAYGVSYYDVDYCYTPTAEQIATAQEQVQNSFAGGRPWVRWLPGLRNAWYFAIQGKLGFLPWVRPGRDRAKDRARDEACRIQKESKIRLKL